MSQLSGIKMWSFQVSLGSSTLGLALLNSSIDFFTPGGREHGAEVPGGSAAAFCLAPLFPADTEKVGGLLLGAISICRHDDAGKALPTWQDYF